MSLVRVNTPRPDQFIDLERDFDQPPLPLPPAEAIADELTYWRGQYAAQPGGTELAPRFLKILEPLATGRLSLETHSRDLAEPIEPAAFTKWHQMGCTILGLSKLWRALPVTLQTEPEGCTPTEYLVYMDYSPQQELTAALHVNIDTLQAAGVDHPGKGQAWLAGDDVYAWTCAPAEPSLEFDLDILELTNETFRAGRYVSLRPRLKPHVWWPAG